jgi:hypothetical protein
VNRFVIYFHDSYLYECFVHKKWPHNGILMPILLCDISPNIINILWNVAIEVYTKHISHATFFISDPWYAKLWV